MGPFVLVALSSVLAVQRAGHRTDICSRKAFLAQGAVLGTAYALGEPPAARAVSGGGKDYSGLTLSGEDFSQQKLSRKEFRQVVAKGTNFKGADLRGSSFFKADLEAADFTGALMSGVSLEGANLDGTILKDAQLDGAFFTDSVTQAADISGADFSEALIPPRTQATLCARADATGSNPQTSASTRESLFCP
jgi:uncharacterized protein YjbI with pentapeptide repeats